MSKIRNKIEKYRNCYCKPAPEYDDDPCIKLFKQKLENDFVIPQGYNGLAVGLQISPGNVVQVQTDSKLVVM